MLFPLNNSAAVYNADIQHNHTSVSELFHVFHLGQAMSSARDVVAIT